MRTYSHATLSDLPAITGAAWLGLQQHRLDRSGLLESVCARRSFVGPDAALHSALPVDSLLLTFRVSDSGRRRLPRSLLAFLMGWAGHVLADALTHAEDARPILWPVSERRFRSSVSYWDRSHHARAVTVVEHGALLLLAVWTLSRRAGEMRPSTPLSG